MKKFGFTVLLTASVIITLSLSISLQSLLAAWNEPAATPPGSNVDVPIYSSSSVAQVISGSNGSLGVGGAFTVIGNSSFTGNVGIGTTTAGYKLDVTGSINASGSLCLAGDCKSSWASVGGSQWTTSGSNIYYSGGNVGIGTTSPVANLSVAGDALVTGALDIGLEYIQKPCAAGAQVCMASCSTGKRPLGGGCAVYNGTSVTGDHVATYPVGGPTNYNGWRCQDASLPGTYSMTASVICARVKWPN